MCVCVHGRRETKVAVPMGKATKTCPSRRVRRCAHVVLRGKRGTLWHSMCSRRNVCEAVAGLKLPCLWGKSHKHVFLDVSEDLLMSFCVAGVALCDIRRLSGGICVHRRREIRVAVLMGKVTKTCPSRRVRRCAHVVLHGKHGTL